MSVIDDVLRRHGLRWEFNPYRIVIESYPQLIVQAGPHFDLRETAIKGAKERVLATERKRRQRANEGLRNVTPTEQYKAPIKHPNTILGPESARADLGDASHA